MRRATIIGSAFVFVLGVLAITLAVRDSNRTQDAPPVAAIATGATSEARAVVPARHAHSGFLYGRIITVDGATYEGRLRWGGDQEAFWGDYFNGAKDGNPWAAYAPGEAGKARKGFEIFGFEVGGSDRSHLNRLFLARFGDLARIEAHFADVLVTLKSGTVVTLDRFAAGDIDDGVRVWDDSRGVVDVDARRISTVEFLPTPPLAGAPDRLYGVVHTRQGQFAGYMQWDQESGVTTDMLDGHTGDEALSLPLGMIRSIVRHSRDSALVTQLDGRRIVLANTADVSRGNRGIYVDDTRYGRVLVSWDAFDRAEFSAGGSGPAYDDFPAARPLAGSVSAHGGRSLAGRLVYDFDETQTTETLDGTFEGVDYAIPFGLIASIVVPERQASRLEPVRIVLRHGGELPLERSGDVGDRNAGMLIFVDGREHPEYVLWTDVERIDFDRPIGAVDAPFSPNSHESLTPP